MARGKRSEKWESVFLAHYAKSRNRLEACDKAEVAPSTVKDRLESDPEFKSKYDECVERYEEKVRSQVNKMRDDPPSYKFILGLLKMLPEHKEAKTPLVINNHNSTNVVSAEETVRKFRELAGIP